MPEVRVKICGLRSVRDALAAQESGASYVGMILSRGFGRSLAPDEAVDIGRAVDTPVVTVLVDEPVDEARRIADLVGASVIQLHGEEGPEFVGELRSQDNWAIWKALRVREPDEVARALDDFGGVVDGVLLDAWHPEQPGGGGVSFCWEAFSDVRDAFPPGVMLILAGGLTPANVRRAVRVLSPDVVDVSSGVELAAGRKDPGLIRSFVERTNRTDPPTVDTEPQ